MPSLIICIPTRGSAQEHLKGLEHYNAVGTYLICLQITKNILNVFQLEENIIKFILKLGFSWSTEIEASLITKPDLYLIKVIVRLHYICYMHTKWDVVV